MKGLVLQGLVACLSLAAAEPLTQTFVLPNGLRVVLLEDHANPLLRASLRVAWGPTEEPLEKEGLGVFLGSLLERVGAGNQSRAAFEKSVAASGVRLRFKASPTRLEWTAAAASADQEAALQALAHLVMRPSLDGPSVEGVRLNASRALESTPPAEWVRRRFLASLQRHPVLDADALNRIGLADLEAFQRSSIRPERAVLGLTGDINLAQAKTLVLLHLGAWGPAMGPVPTPGPPPPTLMHHPDGAPEAWLGAAILTPTPKTRAAMELLGLILDRLPDPPLRQGSDGSRYLLASETAVKIGDLPDKIQALTHRWEAFFSTSLTPQTLHSARVRWRQEEALLPLNPGRLLDLTLERALNKRAQPSDIETVTLADVQSLVTQSLAARHLLVMGVPKATFGTWLREAPALAAWKPAP